MTGPRMGLSPAERVRACSSRSSWLTGVRFGEPKGEKDISGYMKEGAKEGDLGGAISVKLNK